jgi:hypothetical protein
MVPVAPIHEVLDKARHVASAASARYLAKVVASKSLLVSTRAYEAEPAGPEIHPTVKRSRTIAVTRQAVLIDPRPVLWLWFPIFESLESRRFGSQIE